MGRRQSAQLELELPAEAPEAHPAPMGEPVRRPRERPEARRQQPRRMRLWLAVAAFGLALLGAGIVFYQADQFLASDPRFTLPGEAGRAEGSGVRIEGAVHASPARLRQAFAADFGRSVYLIPLEARRRALEQVGWVREARVERHWPHQVVVRIVERAPVAFLMLRSQAGAFSRMALIDAEGVILEAPQRAEFALPVLLGVSPAQPLLARRERVDALLRLLREAGPAASHISEVDASDPSNLKVLAILEGFPVRLVLGDAGFRARLENFLGNYAEIRRRLPQATTFDLRLEGRITAAKGGEGVR
ncbi:MAG: FtsQ-type POTRA domain-containing protein [Acidobacteria bacterium]|nr:FtsQ-type POTRA domain-containing protein [Acidobacteriota bacterium]